MTTKTDAVKARDAVDFQDLFAFELRVLGTQNFPPFDPKLVPVDAAGKKTERPSELYTLIFKEMKLLRCTRCDMIGHERGACWVLQQMYQTSRKLGEKYSAAYA